MTIQDPAAFTLGLLSESSRASATMSRDAIEAACRRSLSGKTPNEPDVDYLDDIVDDIADRGAHVHSGQVWGIRWNGDRKVHEFTRLISLVDLGERGVLIGCDAGQESGAR